jgi:hypothetical protein
MAVAFLLKDRRTDFDLVGVSPNQKCGAKVTDGQVRAVANKVSLDGPIRMTAAAYN